MQQDFTVLNAQDSLAGNTKNPPATPGVSMSPTTTTTAVKSPAASTTLSPTTISSTMTAQMTSDTGINRYQCI